MPTFPLRQRRWCSAAQQHPTRAARESTASTLPYLRSYVALRARHGHPTLPGRCTACTHAVRSVVQRLSPAMRQIRSATRTACLHAADGHGSPWFVTQGAGNRSAEAQELLTVRNHLPVPPAPFLRPRKAGECEGAHIGPRGKASDMRAYERMEGPSNDAGVCAHPVGARLGYIRPCAAVGRAVEPASTSPLIPVASPPVSRAALPTDSGVHRKGRSHTARTGCADKASGLTREHDI